MIAFDTEDDGRGNMFLCCFYNGKEKKYFEYNTFKNFDKLKFACIEYILNAGESIYYAHNLEYDIANIFKGKYFPLVSLYYSGKLLFAEIEQKKIKFYDSFNFSFSSLAKIGNVIGIKKTGDNFNKKEMFQEYLKNPDEVKKYCGIDAEICYKYMESFQESIFNEYDLPIKSTLAGTAQNIYLKKFSKYNISGMNTDERLLNSYYGGRCECFSIGEINRIIFNLDVNSMYPYVMRNKKYPISQFIESKKPIAELYIAHVVIDINNCDYPVIPCRKDKLYFPIGKFETWCTSEEIKLAQKNNQIKSLEYISVFNFQETDYIFKNYVDELYLKRKQAKDNKQDFMSNRYKLQLNSTYGRFALNKPLKKLCAITEKNQNVIDPISDFMGYETININSDKGKNFAIAIFITAYARIELFNLIQTVKQNGFIPLYSDTDSIYFTYYNKYDFLNAYKKIKKLFVIDNYLGNYSFKIYKSGFIQNVKSYYMQPFNENTEYKLKGIPTEYRKEFFETGKTIYNRPIKIRSGVIQKKDFNVWENFEISRRTNYSKREISEKIFEGVFNTFPLQFDM